MILLKLFGIIVGWFACGLLALIIEEIITSITDPFTNGCNDDGVDAMLYLGPISLVMVFIHMAWILCGFICGLIFFIISSPFILIAEEVKKIYAKPAEGEKA